MPANGHKRPAAAAEGAEAGRVKKKQKTAARWTSAEEADLEKAVAAQQDGNGDVDWLKVTSDQIELGHPERKASACQERWKKLRAAKKKELQGAQGEAAAVGAAQAQAGAADQAPKPQLRVVDQRERPFSTVEDARLLALWRGVEQTASQNDYAVARLDWSKVAPRFEDGEKGEKRDTKQLQKRLDQLRRKDAKVVKAVERKAALDKAIEQEQERMAPKPAAQPAVEERDRLPTPPPNFGPRSPLPELHPEPDNAAAAIDNTSTPAHNDYRPLTPPPSQQPDDASTSSSAKGKSVEKQQTPVKAGPTSAESAARKEQAIAREEQIKARFANFSARFKALREKGPSLNGLVVL